MNAIFAQCVLRDEMAATNMAKANARMETAKTNLTARAETVQGLQKCILQLKESLQEGQIATQQAEAARLVAFQQSILAAAAVFAGAASELPPPPM